MDLKIENEWLWMFVKTVSISECRCDYPPNENGILCEACVATQMLDARKRHLTSAMRTNGEGNVVFEKTEYAIDYVDSETIRLTRCR
ncbi:hypothetical protein KAU11_00510 [Candidatus Babeliales bacterium]|nr:hypothetical protein [Candidatus Babeliales bacterium]